VNRVLEAAEDATRGKGGREAKQQIQLVGLLFCCEISGVAVEEGIAENLARVYCCGLELLHQLTVSVSVTRG
jgi:hypothetical protein